MAETAGRPGQKREPRPIENAYWVVPDRFLAGEYPITGELMASYKRIRKLVDRGVTCFMDLTDRADKLPSYEGLVKEVGGDGIELISFPMTEHGIPSSPQQVVTILDAIDERLARDTGLIYLHCLGGVGRTGVVVGCWLNRQGYRGEQGMVRYQELWNTCPMSWSHESPDTQEQRDYVINWREPGSDHDLAISNGAGNDPTDPAL